MTLAGVRKIALAIPGAEEVASYGASAFRISGKRFAMMAVNKAAEPNTLAIGLTFEERDALIAESPDKFYTADHYRPYPWVLVRLSKITESELRDVLLAASKRIGATAKRPRPRASK